MHVLRVNNVNEALPLGYQLVKERHRVIDARFDKMWEYPEPVCTYYHIPWERVLFNPVRNKNHFFELFEALWILAGRDDVAFLTFFNKRMADFSDNGETYHAPYGHRLRAAHGFDQISELISLFRKDRNTQRGVLQIWDAVRDLNVSSKDIPCNDLLFFKIRDGELHLTVANRSNDVLWGAYGTNVVQFSMIQEYIAAYVQAPVGTYRQVSDSFHMYPDNPLVKQLEDSGINPALAHNPYADPRAICSLLPGAEPRKAVATPLVEGKYTISDWSQDLWDFFTWWDEGRETAAITDVKFRTYYFNYIVRPMYLAWVYRDAFYLEKMPFNSDWRMGAEIWFYNRELRRKEKDGNQL